jgi:hypothetical protein
MPDFNTDITQLAQKPYTSGFVPKGGVIATIQKTAPQQGQFAAFQFEHIRYNCNINNLTSFQFGDSKIVGARKVSDGTTANNSIYLPYGKDKIYSVRLSTNTFAGLRYFFTANLSGCAIFLDRRPNGRLYAYHANTHIHSGAEEVKRRVPTWQHPEAIHRLRTMHRLAAQDHPNHNTRVNVGELFKATYLNGAADIRKIGKILRRQVPIKNKDWLGGTFVVGIRGLLDQWTFHYQSWGRSTRANVNMGVAGYGTFAINV